MAIGLKPDLVSLKSETGVFFTFISILNIHVKASISDVNKIDAATKNQEKWDYKCVRRTDKIESRQIFTVEHATNNLGLPMLNPYNPSAVKRSMFFTILTLQVEFSQSFGGHYCFIVATPNHKIVFQVTLYKIL